MCLLFNLSEKKEKRQPDKRTGARNLSILGCGLIIPPIFWSLTALQRTIPRMKTQRLQRLSVERPSLPLRCATGTSCSRSTDAHYHCSISASFCQDVLDF